MKTIADRPSVHTIPGNFRAVVKTIVDRPSVYTVPASFRVVVKTIADRPSVYTWNQLNVTRSALVRRGFFC